MIECEVAHSVRGDDMSFYDFMLAFQGDATPLGELATFLMNDIDFPRDVIHPSEILAYFHKHTTVDNDMIETVKRALQLYANSKGLL